LSQRTRSTLEVLGALLLTVLGVVGFGLGLVWMKEVVTHGVDATWRDYVPSYTAFLASSVLLIFGLLFLARHVLRSADGE
jgi:apolipoprotein N-acyltransferase